MSVQNPLFDRQALETFKESHPERGSVHQIVALPEDEFVQNYADAFNGDAHQARRVYQTAIALQNQSALVWANLKDLASPFTNNGLFNTIPPSFLQHQESIPGYDRLFGNLDYIDCDPCRSVFGPAAYFVDLMRFVETFITERNPGIPDAHRLENRRRDLFNLKLDCANTNDLIAYIDLVNETLEAIVATANTPDADQVLHDARFPSNLPYNIPLAEIRSYLSQLKLSLTEVYQTFETTPATKTTAITREILDLSPAEFEIIRTELIAPVDLRTYYGLDNTQHLSSLAIVATFLEATGLNREELNDLIFQDLDRNEVNAGLSRLFFINAVEDGLGWLSIAEGEPSPNSFYQVPQERLENLSSAKLDRIYRFVKLARKLGWSFADLDRALRSLQPEQIPNQAPERVLSFDGVNDFVTVENVTKLDLPSFTIEAWINPARAKINPILYKGDNITVDNPSIHFLFGLDADNQLVFHTQSFNISGRTIISLDVFTHVAVTISSSEVRFYINGKPEPTIQATIAPITPVGTTLNIGADLGYEFFAGSIQEVRIWQGVRTEAEIVNHRYRRLPGQETGLVAYWSLIESAANQTQISDRTSNPNHGILGGAGTVTQPQWVPQDLVLEPAAIALEQTAYTFNGDDQYLAIRASRGLTIDASTGNQLTLEAWINLAESRENTIFRLGSVNATDAEFEFGVTRSGDLSIAVAGTAQTSSNLNLPLNQWIHVAVIIQTIRENNRDRTQVRFYRNGQEIFLGSLPDSIVITDSDLEIGRNLRGDYFKGQLREVRFWNQARTAEEIQRTMNQVLPIRAEGLIGYWRLNQIEAGMAQDLSYNQNHLFLGGIPEDYMPDRILLPNRLLPPTPIATTGTVLDLDGSNDVIVVSNPQDAGLGQSGRLTLELWFRPTNLAARTNLRQVIYSQGDAKAGLNVYLFENRLYVLAWCQEPGQTVVQETSFRSDPLPSDTWHHVAVTNDETRSRLFVEFRAFLNGTELPLHTSTPTNPTLQNHQRGYRLSPTGVAYLGGIGEGGVIRFAGAIAPTSVHTHYFAGQITDLRLWKRVRTAAEIATERYAAPLLSDADLIAYLPLDEGKGNDFSDRSGNGFVGKLQERNLVLLTNTTDPELENLHSHYNPADGSALSWTNYVYTGRIYIPTQANAALGVTVFSRHPKNVDQYYRLEWSTSSNQPSFRFTAHPQGVQPLTVITGTDGISVPERDRWYQFRIEVENNQTANRTDLRAKIWQDGTPEPQPFQLEAQDDSSIRITAGTVGIWVRSRGGAKQFDDLQVVPLAGNTSAAATHLLAETFETYTDNQNPIDWLDTGDRLTPQNPANLFGTLQVGDRSVFGTNSTLNNIHAHYAPANATTDVLNWTNYTVTGRMRITAADSGIGMTVLSRYPAGIDQYYSLRRDASHPSFYLTAHPQEVQPVRSLLADRDATDSRITPAANVWYRFRIEVQSDLSQNRTLIRAKIWQDGTAEPTAFQIEAYDDSPIRIQSGTVGLWASGNGSKYFDQLNVLRDVLLSENFNTYAANQDPTNWRDTRENNSRDEDNTLFRTAQIQNQNGTVFGNSSPRVNIHSHYNTPESLIWSNYVYTGRMYITDANAGVGVTFYSRYPNTAVPAGQHDFYYRLRRFQDSPTFHISPHRGNGNTPDEIIKGRRDSGVNPTPNTWYQFRIEVENAGSRTNIRAKVWQDGNPEPAEFQIDAYDDARDRLTAGTVGLWSRSNGSKYFDDLFVQRSIFLPNSANNWQMTGSRNPFEVNDSLFKTVDVRDNTARWITTNTYPLLLHPLNRNALEFDGQREYLAAANLAELNFSTFTIAAWIHPTRSQANPVFSWQDGTNSDSLWFGVTSENTLVLRRESPDASAASNIALGKTAISPGQFNHIAISVNGNAITFYVNGNPDIPDSVSAAIALNTTALEIGRSLRTYFAGQIQDICLWKTVRTADQFAPTLRYQQPDLSNPDLVDYWSFPETDGAITQNASIRALTLRLGGLESARRPTLNSPSDSATVATLLPAIALNDITLQSLATIRQLQARHNLPIDRLTALWFEISHTGQDDGQTLFDRVFNSRGITGEVWNYTQYPMRWTVTGQSRQDRETRSRLMGALQVSSEDLDRSVQHLSQTATQIELDGFYLTRLYHLAQIPKVLRLSVQDFLRLLALMNLIEVNTLTEFKQVSDRANWLQRTGIQVSELEFLILPPSDQIPRPYTNGAIRDMAAALTNQSSEFLVTGNSFVSDLVNLSQSIEIVNSLKVAGIVDELATVVGQYQPPVSLPSISGLPDNPDLRQMIQTQVEETLTRMQQEHANAILERLSELFQVEPERVRIVSDRLKVTPSTFLGWMQEIAAASDTQPLPSQLTDYLNQLTKGLYLITRFDLTTDEAIALLQNPTHFSVTDVFNPTIVDLEYLVMFTELKTAFNDVNGGLIRVFAQATNLEITKAILNLADWDSTQLTALTTYFENQSTTNRIPELHRLYRAFALAETLQVDIELLIQLSNTDSLTFAFYRQQADVLLNVVRSRYDDEQWQRVYKPIRDRLTTQKRDALLSYALTRQLPDTFQSRRDADVLYEYLLLDVQIGSEVETSRIVQGLAALQLYVQRCLLNLEQGVNPNTIPLEQWNWMKNYRVWEANRKVFLYPESYIEPELRDTKTPLFEQLEQELMQGEVNQTNIETAFNNYLNKLSELADLKVIGAYLHKDVEELFRIPENSGGAGSIVAQLSNGNLANGNLIPSPLRNAFATRGISLSNQAIARGSSPLWRIVDGDAVYTVRLSHDNHLIGSRSTDSTLYFVGRSTTEPRTTYYRELVNNIQWLPWKQIDLPLNTDFVTPVFAFNRLFLFWVEFTEVSRQLPGTQTNRTFYQPIVRYSYPDFNNTWATPQTYAQIDRELDAEERSLTQWQRVYALRSLFEVSRLGDVSFESRERILVIYGDTNLVDTPINVRTLRNARDQEQVRLQFGNGVTNTGNSLDMGLTPPFLGQLLERLGYTPTVVDQQQERLDLLAAGTGNAIALDTARDRLHLLLTDGSLTARPSNVPPLDLPLQFSVEKPANNHWFINYTNSEGTPARLEIRREDPREGPRLSVYRSVSWFAGYMTLANLTILNEAVNESASEEQLERFRTRVLNDLFGRPTTVNRLEVQPGFRVERQGDNQWFITFNRNSFEDRLLVRQEEGRLNVYRFSLEFLRGWLNNLLQRDFPQSEIPFNSLQLEDRGGNRWLAINPSNGERFLLTPQDRNFVNVYRFANAVLYATSINDAGINDYAIAVTPVQLSTAQPQILFNTLPLEASLLDVNNQQGSYILDTGEEQFLMSAEVTGVATDVERLIFPAAAPNTLFTFQADPLLQGTPQFRFERLDTSAVRELSVLLFREGIDGLLSLRAQQTRERNFAAYLPAIGNNSQIIPPQAEAIDFNGAYGLYYREIFFHIPFFIANQLNANQNFATAQRWYHYIFNPTSQETINGATPTCPTNAGYLDVLPDRDRYWQYLPLRQLCVDSITRIINNQQALAEYRNDPFDPHAIAQLRVNAYQKAIVMKYIDNLLDWGDYLFNQNNRESIGEAAQLYVLAYNLLGPRPAGRTNRKFEEIGDYNAIRQVFNNNPPDFLTEFSGNGALTVSQNGTILTTFCVTENADFAGFWDRVSDRLFKIRHSLNIDGIFRQLDLFQPVLDVRVLVQAFASGNRDISSILADINRPVPHYRYAYMLDKAKELTETVISLGSSLLEAIQNRDSEQLAVLENTHERAILDLTTTIQRHELEATRESLKALEISNQNIQARHDYYDRLLENGIGFAAITSEEEQELTFRSSAQALRLVTNSFKSLESSLVSLKGFNGTVGPLGTKLAEEGFPNLVSIGAEIALLGADGLEQAGETIAQIGAYKLRKQEWEQERRTAVFELREINQQIAVTQIQIQIAEQALAIHDRTIQQNQEIADFYRRKFTNQQLYNWMIGRISGLYFQAYKLAYATAKDAERAFQYEFGDDSQFINYGHWDSLRRGLLAGESLQLDLMRLEKYAIDQDSRYQEIEKIISLRTALPEAFAMLRSNSNCFFNLTERMFDEDYPGHFFRVIKSIAITVKSSAVNADQSLNATLIQLNNRALLEPDIEGVRYLLNGANQTDDIPTSIRSNWRANQQIAVSRPNRDNGMFGNFDSLLLFDDRYFPFEGTGAVSSWELEMPQANQFLAANDSDIIIHLKYTSRSDRGAFRRQVQAELR